MRRDTRYETAPTLERSLVAAYQENLAMQEAVAVLHQEVCAAGSVHTSLLIMY